VNPTQKTKHKTPHSPLVVVVYRAFSATTTKRKTPQKEKKSAKQTGITI
jgi:hypothetical protein